MRIIIKLFVKFRSQITKLRLRFRKTAVSQDPPPSGMDRETILQKIAQVPYWWHSIELGRGIITPGDQGGLKYPTGAKNLLANLKLPGDLSGKSVLDIGAWDGFFSFALEKRGASRVLAIDNFYRDQLEHIGNQGFQVAKEILKSNVEFRKASLYDLSPEEFGMFDVVLCLGVFYHLKYPLLALEKIYSVTGEMLVLETHYDPYDLRSAPPRARFCGRGEINDDPTSWWEFNESGLIALLSSVGFKNPEVVYRYADRIGIKTYRQ